MFFLIIILYILPQSLCKIIDKVETPYGNISGTEINVLGEKITEYLGVPYAYPPKNNYRFKKPVELKKPSWNGTYNAITLANACPQIVRFMNFSGYDASNPKNATNEECLQFNMWVPKGKNLPVLVFFHGGSWTLRTASVDKFNGSVLALKTKSIVVTPNFRLGFFGFAYLGNGSKISGNMGLLDQQMMLKWINMAIEPFGGDKNKVTIFGTSSGASSVAAHLFSEASKPYFIRGIMSSGTITHFMSTISPKLAEANTRNVSTQLGCNGDDNKILECLQSKSVNELLIAASKAKQPTQPPIPFSFIPINCDDVFFKGCINDKIIKESYNKDVDLIFGKTKDEATFFMATGFTNNTIFNCHFYPLKSISDFENGCIMNKTNFENLVNLGGKLLLFGKNEIHELYNIYDKLSYLTYTEKSIRILSDFIFNCDLSAFATKYSNSSSKNVYFYTYTKRSPINVWPKWTGAMHGDDLIDIFGIPFRHPEKYDEKILEKEKSYSDNVMWTIGNFTSTGNPSLYWEKYTPNNTKSLDFNGKLDLSKTSKHVDAIPSTCIEISKIIKKLITVNFKVKTTLLSIETTTTSLN
ncbi:Acetylcholinesterase [Strongyloides ratti]|uniref:Carboxylic ester hydrolase n=1 Tax=Strongyloides ratti TaxID=34506 RepID=A0A090LR07_STRRB|nr:Acetylcholinesterase [Strongyloides ratti]CEF70611.1 Acetylcholinesterase [Strongyloides ratti]